MTLSPAGQAFLEKQERRPFIKDRAVIELALQKAKVPTFEPVIQFQLNYGGYTFYAGYEPLGAVKKQAPAMRYPSQ